MKQYIDCLTKILDEGEWNSPARENMPMTKSLHGLTMQFDLREGFPALTTKRLAFKQACAEICWIMRGETNVKWLWDNGDCHVWDKDAYRYYTELTNGHSLSFEAWKNCVEQGLKLELYDGPTYTYGDCGRIYGHQFRSFGGVLDQLRTLVNSLKTNPSSRYHIISAWNPVDFFVETEAGDKKAALPSCPIVWQFFSNGEYLDMIMYQRSADFCLGVPFNLAEGAIIMHVICELTGLKPRNMTWVGGDCHVYLNHVSPAEEQIERKPLASPRLRILHRKDFDIDNVAPNDFELINYRSHPAIGYKLSVGL